MTVKPKPCDTSVDELANASWLHKDKPSYQERSERIDSLLNYYTGRFGIANKYKLQHFLAQAAEESDGLSDMTGDLYYSKENLLEHYSYAFSDTDPNKLDPDDYAGHPQKMAEFLMGPNSIQGPILGNDHDGDGWKYRGRGILQLTGRYNYTQFTSYYQNEFNCTLDFVQNPDLLATDDKLAVLSGMWYFMNRVSGDIDENTTVDEVTYDVNGGYNGLDQRKQYFNDIKQYINDCSK